MRRQISLRVALASVMFWAAASLAAQSPAITTESLLKDMTDLAGMAEFPSPAYTVKQFSSYDRRSTDPKVLTEGNWFANGDAGQYLRVENRTDRQEFVMMDAAGPGAIVRIWSANPQGTLRIYIDGQATPVIEAAFTDILGGKYPGLPRPIAGERSRGWNLYFPIPYAKSCKVTSDNGKFYYHVNYRTYPAGTTVQSFKAEQIAALEGKIKQLAEALMAPGADAGSADNLDREDFEWTIGPGETHEEVIDADTPMAVYGTKMMVSAGNRESALRGVIFKGEFDGNATVESPIGDFFGAGPGINPYNSLPMGVTKEGQLWSRWVMPFRQRAVFRFVNTTREPVTITGTGIVGPYNWTDNTMYFNAKWRIDFDVPTRPMIDWNYLTATGQGVFAGVAFMIDNPVKDWWGEGDEKIYVDGETFPSHFGTGTEDYYGYAWCSPILFTHAYHNQPRCDGPGNFGRTSVNRWHILDRIPFTKDFKFDMELWHWNANVKVNMAVISYWYAKAGAKDTFKPIAATDVVLRPAPVIQIVKVAGALEGEKLKVIKKVGELDPQDWDGLSSGVHLWWHGGMKVGDELVLGFDAPKAGKYKVSGRFLRAVDYGIHQLSINGQEAGKPIDFFNQGVVPTNEIDLGTFDLKQGENTLTVKVIGANPKATGVRYMFGLDYLLLKAAE